VLVSGYSGVGKSSVVNELHKVPFHRGLFASGKFDQYKRDIPYGDVGTGFQTVSVKSSQEREEVGQWRNCPAEAVGQMVS